MTTIALSDYLSDFTDPDHVAAPLGQWQGWDLAAFLAAWPDLHARALARLNHRIHPTAFVHPTAQIGPDVIIGHHAKVFEFSSVRGLTVVGAGASIGFNSEITQCCIGEETVLGHRIGMNRTLVGSRAHLSAHVLAAAIHLTRDMRSPDREVFTRTPGGLVRLRTPRFGALIGDRVQSGARITLNPGCVIGRGTLLGTDVTVPPARMIPSGMRVTNPHSGHLHIAPPYRAGP
ncbi:transferase [Streptomyces sp. NPDC050703]|uniref:transferase n=1 Tax=Streptomyces sp. NPDC050703 TaxID=3157218 RepID=UPI00342A64BC